MKVELIKYPTAEDWILCRQCTLVTIGKDSKTEPTLKWKKDILRARHSPIRVLNFVFRLEVPYWVAGHLVRHVHAQPFVRSQRNDRQSKYDRTKAPQDSPVTMMWYMNAEELMVIANKRLCRTASDETRAVVQLMCNEVHKHLPEFEGLLVPMCQYGRCNEIFPCNK